VDRFDLAHKRAGLAEQYARTDRLVGDRAKVFSITPLPENKTFKDVLPLQAADFIAWELRELAEERKSWTYSSEEREQYRLLSQSYARWERQYREEQGTPREFVAVIRLLETTRDQEGISGIRSSFGRQASGMKMAGGTPSTAAAVA
jgi:hypothetical protein